MPPCPWSDWLTLSHLSNNARGYHLSRTRSWKATRCSEIYTTLRSSNYRSWLTLTAHCWTNLLQALVMWRNLYFCRVGSDTREKSTLKVEFAGFRGMSGMKRRLEMLSIPWIDWTMKTMSSCSTAKRRSKSICKSIARRESFDGTAASW